MKKLVTTAAFAALISGSAQAADDVTLQLQWVTQGQFAGYYVALDKGWYEEEDLNVTILPGGPDIAPPQVLAGGGADVMLNWMPSALSAREGGLPLVNIAQPFKSSGLMLTCWKDTGITAPEDFRGKTLGTWFFGNEFPLLNWLGQLGIPTEGGDDGATIQKINFNVDPLLQRQVDCATTMTYNEYWQVIDAGVTEDEIITFRYSDYGVATMEDGMYVLEDSLEDPAFVDKMARFLKASMRGWEFALANPEESAEIILEYDETGAQTYEHQVRMIGEVAKLTEGSDGTLDPADLQRTVDTLLAGGSDPVITRQPDEAFSTTKITDLALN
ncbi:MAG: ABC transporter substrate-binding protein [Paracoccaceae bacterium]|nr:ABC transporter substrate-binding protein [Paracoccaceae bacterium]